MATTVEEGRLVHVFVRMWLFYMIIGEDIYICVYLPVYKHGIAFKISLDSQPVVAVYNSM